MEKLVQNEETLLSIASRLLEEQRKDKKWNINEEHTMIVVGTRGAGKTTIINAFQNSDSPIHPTVGLEYSYVKRTKSEGLKNGHIICNIWEAESTNNSQLINIPIKSNGLENCSIIVIMDLSQPDNLWTELESIINSVKYIIESNITMDEVNQKREQRLELIKKNCSNTQFIDPLPIPIVIVGNKNDLFENSDPAIKKNTAIRLRAIAHSVGAALLYHSNRSAELTQALRHTLNHFAFKSPEVPIRKTVKDHNYPLMIWFGADNWDDIGTTQHRFIADPDISKRPLSNDDLPPDPALNKAFAEPIIDEWRARKLEELKQKITTDDDFIGIDFTSLNVPSVPSI